MHLHVLEKRFQGAFSKMSTQFHALIIYIENCITLHEMLFYFIKHVVIDMQSY